MWKSGLIEKTSTAPRSDIDVVGLTRAFVERRQTRAPGIGAVGHGQQLGCYAASRPGSNGENPWYYSEPSRSMSISHPPWHEDDPDLNTE